MPQLNPEFNPLTWLTIKTVIAYALLAELSGNRRRCVGANLCAPSQRSGHGNIYLNRHWYSVRGELAAHRVGFKREQKAILYRKALCHRNLQKSNGQMSLA